VTEEYPENDPQDFEFPQKQLNKLYDEEPGSPTYKIAASNLTKGLRDRGVREEAVEVFDYLEDGDVEAAEELTEGVLEQGGGQL
jgi:hypothetical protein